MRRQPRRLSLVAVLICATGLLAACQTTLAGKTSGAATPNAVTGDAIEVTALDAVPGAAAAGATLPETKPAGAGTAAPQGDPARPDSAAGTEPAVEAAEPAPKPDMTEVPVTPKSEQQLACEKKKGRWARIGKGNARACVFETRDSGKRCERESQCEGVCLARSGTCAPFKPLYGCNEILQDNGARVTLCLD
ncbi:MAG: hypothetical protein J0L76_20625 [Rhodobacterales bacterium]|nr:hypothetical protein [Rhodobacterales bacterium]